MKSLQLRATLLFTLVITVYCLGQLQGLQATAPTIDYSHNMRILKLPKSTQVGEIIYRLKGSDGDPNSQLHFGVSGISGRSLLDIVRVPGAWNEADVYLRARLQDSTTDQEQDSPAAMYNLTIYVSDGSNKTTQVDSTIMVTNDDELAEPEPDPLDTDDQRRYFASNSSAPSFGLTTSLFKSAPGAGRQGLSPFLRPRHVFSVPENAQPGESLGQVNVRESDKSDLPVRFELRGRGSEHFGIRYVFGPKGQSRGELFLSQPVDYERQNLFQLKVLALNAWTNVKYDTRNVATLDIVVSVGDVQDTAPQFKQLPHALRLANNMRVGDLVARVQAEDGDYADQRPVQYALDASSPLAGYFAIDKQTGDITLQRPVEELAALHLNSINVNLNANTGARSTMASGLSGGAQLLTVYASEQPDQTSYDHLWPPMIARAELPLLLVDVANEPPRFIGGWLTGGVGSGSGSSQPTLRGFVTEFASPAANSHKSPGSGNDHDDSLDHKHAGVAASTSTGQLVQWYTNYTTLDLGATSAHSDGALGQQLLRSTRGRPLVLDLGQGPNGTFELSLEGPDAHLFELEPGHPVTRLTMFQLVVAPTADRALFDFDSSPSGADSLSASAHQKSFQVELVARDFGSPQRQSSRLKCQIDLLDLNDNAPQFDSDLYTFPLLESAQTGQILGNIRARDLDRLGSAAGGAFQRVRYTALSGRDSHLFRLDPESGLITLEGQLDREKQDHYLLLAEARDTSGLAANYTKIMVNVLDVNDNAPVFSQSHYDAVLQADGTFYQPLVVSAGDADEPNSANSQVAYEIIAGNQNDQFMIDSLSGAIYPSWFGSPPGPIQLPSILSEPILPFLNTRDGASGGTNNNNNNNNNNNIRQPDQHGKIQPSSKSSHEVEETTVPGVRQSPLRLNWPRSAGHRLHDVHHEVEPSPHHNHHHEVRATQPTSPDQSNSSNAPATAPAQRGLGNGPLDLAGASPRPPANFDLTRVPPLTTLVVRAHDFGIPLRSATCKVNIYNQALQSRSISVILNGTAELLEQRRELIERAFGALSGSRAIIESIDALSDSSSISVARIRLAVPAGHSLIDLTDLSSLMTAIDYKVPQQTGGQQQQLGNQLDQSKQPIHYITTGDRIYPIHHSSSFSNISSATTASGGGGGGGGGAFAGAFYTDLQQIDYNSSMLERKLLFYIIILGVCILALLVIWMIYFCCRESQQQLVAAESAETKRKQKHMRQLQSSSEDSLGFPPGEVDTRNRNRKDYKHKTSGSKTHLIGDEDQFQLARSASQLNLNLQEQQQQQQQGHNKTHAKMMADSTGLHPIGNNLAKQHQLSIPSSIKPEHHSMYNGQVWFEQGGLVSKKPSHQFQQHQHQRVVARHAGGRRVSSAPSASGISLDSGLRALINGRASAMSPTASGLTTPQRLAAGQFFPNTLGYTENLATIATPSGAGYIFGPHMLGGRRGRGRKVAPLAAGMLAGPGGPLVPHQKAGYANEAFEQDLESGGDAGSGLVLVPVGGSSHPKSQHHKTATTTTTTTKESKKAHHHHHHHHHHQQLDKSRSKSKSASSSSCSTTSTNSEATQTLDDHDHESIMLDSDQELLGFDSTGTPIIATRTRNRAGTNASRSLLSDMGLASPAATVINAATGSKAAESGEKVEQQQQQDVLATKSTPGADQRRKSREGAQETPGQKKEGATEGSHPESGVERTSEAGEAPPPAVAEESEQKVGASHTIAPAIKTSSSTTTGQGRQSLDLMGELSERLNSANRQRALRRQSADQRTQAEGELETSKVAADGQQQQQQQQQQAASKTDGAEPRDTKALDASNETAAATPTATTRMGVDVAHARSRQQDGDSARFGRRASESMSCQSTISEGQSTTAGGLRDMKNGELLEKQSIFAMTYSGLATDKLPG